MDLVEDEPEEEEPGPAKVESRANGKVMNSGYYL